MADPKNKWSQPAAPPAPMFFGEKERDLVKQVNDELAERVIGQTIAYYPISIEDSNFNDLYGEAIEKVSLPPVRVFAYVEVANEQTNEKYGYEYKSSLTVNFHRKRLVDDQNLYVRVGDFIQYGDEYYEIVRTYNDTRYYFGQVEHKFQITADCITARAGNFKVMPAVDRPVDKTTVDSVDGSTRPAPRSAPYPPVDADYLTLTRQPRVTNSRYLVAGAGITFTDGGRLAGLTIAATGQNATGMTGSVQYQTGGGTFSGSANFLYLTGSNTLSITGDVSASANVSASAFFGDGSNLSGITTGPAGSDTQVQYNDGGALAGSSNLTFDGSILTVTGNAIATRVSASSGVSGSAVQGGTISSDGAITGGSLTDGTATITAGAISGGTSYSGSTTIQGASVAVDGAVTARRLTDGAATITSGAGSGFTTFAGTQLSGSTGVSGSALQGGSLTVSGYTVGVEAASALNQDLTSDASPTFAGATLSGLTATRLVLVGTSGELEDNGNLTFNGTSVSVTGDLTASVNVSASAFYGDGSNLTNLPGGTGGIFTTPNGSTAYTTSSVQIGGSGTPTQALEVVGTVEVDKNHSDTDATTVTGLEIDFDKTGASTSNNTMYGLKLDMDNATATNGANSMYGLHVTPTLTHAADAGNTLVYGALINAQGGTNGTSFVQGARIEAGGGDINYGLQLDIEDGGVDLRIESSADNGDYFQIQTTTHGATTITTYDDDATAADLTFNVDGDIAFYPVGGDMVLTGSLSASVNISASAFYGDGSNLTGITSGGGSANAQGPVGSLQFQTGSGGISGSAALSFATGSSALTVGGDISVSSMTASGDVVLDQDQRIYFESDKGTWIETDSADRLRFVVGSNQMLLLDEDDDRVNIGYGNKLGVGLGNNTTPSALLHVSSSDDKVLFRVDGATAGNVLFATGSGRVGIGTTSPDYTLDVAGDIGVDQYIYHNGDANTYLNFTNDRLRFNIGGISYIDLNDAGTAPHDVTINDGSNNVDFIVKGNGSNGGNPLFKTDASTGRVGINGVGSPSWELDVDGDIGLAEYIYHKDDDDTYIRFRTDQIDFVAGGLTFLTLDENTSDIIAVNNGANDIDFQVQGSGSANLIRTDAANDMVGIGTATPSHLLTAAGSSHLSGGLVHKRTAVASNYTASITDYILGVTSVPVSIEFDATSFSIGQVVVVKDESGTASSANPITLTPSASQTIDGSPIIPIESPYGALLLYSDGTNWYIY